MSDFEVVLLDDEAGGYVAVVPALPGCQTQGETLEDAFMALTGHTIREEEASSADTMRMMRRVWRR